MNGRRLQVAFFLSLGLNLFLVGLMVGGLLIKARGAEEPRPRRSGHYWSAAEAFDPADREAFREVMRRTAADVAPRVEAMRQARREAREAVAGPTFDPAGARAALSRAHAEEFAVREAFDAAVMQFAARLDADERMALAESMRRRKDRPRSERRDR